VGDVLAQLGLQEERQLDVAQPGLPTNMLRPSLEAASIDLAAQGSGSDSLAAAIARDGNFNTSRDLYSAGTLSAA
jgi:hypothetical protein